MSPRPLVLSSLIALLFSGCATQEALTEQTRPMQDRLDRLEQALKASSEVGDARHKAFGRDIDGLKSAVKVLVARLDEQGGRTHALAKRLDEAAAGAASQAERIAETETRLDKLATATRQAVEQSAENQAALSERVSQAELRLDELATVGRQAADSGADEQDRLAERMSQAELRLDELATTVPARLAEAEQQIEALSGSVKEALVLAAQENIRLNGKEAFAVLLTEDKTLYPINSPELGAQDIAKLDELVERIGKLEQDCHLEIQGHTDNLGTEDYNYELGKARAEVVKRFLHERRGIPLGQMSVISFGAGSPLDRSGSNNRRIAIRVLVPK
jgi:outer membrane protein OmpA-like peptidoglycan-associated protein